MLLYKIEADEFLMVIGNAISDDESKNKKATEKFREIMNESMKLKDEYEEYKSSKDIENDSDDLDDDSLDDFLGGLGISRS
jgi:hypothetical protein